LVPETNAHWKNARHHHETKQKVIPWRQASQKQKYEVAKHLVSTG
jgi:hypothetical protein